MQEETQEELTFADLRNQSEYTFFDATSESYREYVWLSGDGPRKGLVIPNPVAVAVSKSGHRILDAAGDSYFIPSDWTYITWRAKKDAPHFVK